MKKYTRHFTTTTPQSMPIPESNQIRNRAGGWVFPVTDEIQAERFLILGTSDGSYYADARELTREAATCIERLLEDDKGIWLVDKIVEVSDSGRAPKNDQAIFALAMALKLGDLETRRAAATAMPKVCRTATHMAQFAEAVKVFTEIHVTNGTTQHYSWNPVVKRAFQNWLDSKTDDQLAYQLVKYRQREGWTMRDVLRRAKPSGHDLVRHSLYAWATGKRSLAGVQPQIINAFEAVQNAEHAAEVVGYIQRYNLPWEAVPSKWAKNLDVQAALLEHMPIGATIRNLGRLSSIGLLVPGSDAERKVVDRIANRNAIQRGRIHPMNLYLATEVYRVGRGLRGHLTWTPAPKVIDALGEGFFQSFDSVQPTGKNILVAVDTSGSMRGTNVMGIPGFSATEAAFAMAFVTLRNEPNAQGLLFNTHVREFDLRDVETLEQLQTRGRSLHQSFTGGTDCAAPIIHATQSMPNIDAFCIYTDMETWAGTIHPVEAQSQYRQRWGQPTKMVDVAFVANAYDLTQVDDAETLAVVGMDDNVPSLVADFLR